MNSSQNSSWGLKTFTDLQATELPHSEDGNAQLLKTILKTHNYLRKGIKMDITVCVQCTLLITTSRTDIKCVVELKANLSGFISSISAENVEKRRHISNTKLLILCISRYFHFLCSHWGHLWQPLLWANVANLGLWGISWGQEGSGSALKTLNPYTTPQIMVLPIWE